MSVPFLSDVYSWGVCFYILLSGQTSSFKSLDTQKMQYNFDDLKENPKDHEEILKALEQCHFYGSNCQKLKSKFLPILRTCLNYYPKRRMNFLQLDFILKEFDKLSEEEINEKVKNFSNDEQK